MIRKHINKYLIENIPKDKYDSVSILFSGGMDSLSILLSCLDLGITPSLYTFRLSNHVSNDFETSRKISEIFNLNFNEIILDVSNIDLLDDVKYIIGNFNVKKKTQIQCIHPFLYINKYINEEIVLSGICADDLYGTARSVAKYWSDYQKFYDIRYSKHLDEYSSSYKYIRDIFRNSNHLFLAPYKESDLLSKHLLNKTYKEMNSPKIKNIMYVDYKNEIDKYDLYRRNSNLQCESKIREWHNCLLSDCDININNNKSIVGIYNRIFKEVCLDEQKM